MEGTATRIGNVGIIGKLVLGPMSGITDLAFRLVSKSFGCSLGYVPLVSAKALVLGSRKTFELLETDPAEKPVAVQLFGGEPDVIGRAVEILKPYPFDLVDINMGCPAPKVAGHAGGSSLLRDPGLAAEIVRAAVQAAGKPVTAKIRSGWDERSTNAVEIALMLQEAGASAIVVHPRTKAQRFTGRANWNIIRQVKQAVRIPVVGNGDVSSPEDAKRMLEQTGCDLVMVARAARGNPWIFQRGNYFLQEGKTLPQPSPHVRVQTLIRHCTILAQYEGERTAALKMRKHAGWYIKGLQNAASARERINKAQTTGEIILICRDLEHQWHESCSP
ncbi:MAG: tRNA dihydrouridine synthase DusB [Candidatus Abyssobacteria bacterium SURF_5]|uniref:tRNA-dihydrouridine synthase n=1 Tax=Abyssobacteria bacterium (strain SURF_5) TaxID=2093360 RepID=A0A3A4N9B9_ABYX5|nr:MAG: tRNA dihydrouridine synthase DusB [Candidatus Abyssubacteria bacterium SURF_5]